MPKPRNDSKQKQNENSQNTFSAGKFCSSPLKQFIKSHNKALNCYQKQLEDLTEQCDQRRLFEINRNSTIEELKHLLETKTNESEQLNINYENLESEYKKLQEVYIKQRRKFVDLEVLYDQYQHQLQEKNQLLQKENERINLVVIAKEAECAAYLKDMRNQLHIAESRYSEAEGQIASLQSNIMELESELQNSKCETDAAIKDKNEIIKKHKIELSKKQNKLIRRENKVRVLEQNLRSSEHEKKELKKSLETEGLKLRELQRVLDRPYNRISPIRDQTETVNQPITPVAQVEPVNADNETGSSTADSMSRESVIITQLKMGEIQPPNLEREQEQLQPTLGRSTQDLAILDQAPNDSTIKNIPEQTKLTPRLNLNFTPEVKKNMDQQYQELKEPFTFPNPSSQRKGNSTVVNTDCDESDDVAFYEPYKAIKRNYSGPVKPLPKRLKK